MSNVGQRKTVMFSDFKERWLVKPIVAALFSVVLFGMMGTALADDVSSFDELESILIEPGKSEVTIDLRNENDDIQLEREINVNKNITKLTIYMNGNTIDVNGNPFLNFKGTCELAIKNTKDDYDPSHY